MKLVFRSRDAEAADNEQREAAAARWKADPASASAYEILEDGQRLYDAWTFASNNGSLFVAGTKELAPFELVDGVVTARAELTEAERRDALQQAYDVSLDA
jgi:hypothetical protein